eukprot:m.251160 g.251160  ORF g.251160 m.251160 type:complete len:1064 (+) comp17518_c0_seq2:2008-5199(+)
MSDACASSTASSIAAASSTDRTALAVVASIPLHSIPPGSYQPEPATKRSKPAQPLTTLSTTALHSSPQGQPPDNRHVARPKSNTNTVKVLHFHGRSYTMAPGEDLGPLLLHLGLFRKWYPGVVSSLKPLGFCTISAQDISEALISAHACISTPTSHKTLLVGSDLTNMTISLGRAIAQMLQVYLVTATTFRLKALPGMTVSETIFVASWQTRSTFDWRELALLSTDNVIQTEPINMQMLPPTPLFAQIVVATDNDPLNASQAPLHDLHTWCDHRYYTLSDPAYQSCVVEITLNTTRPSVPPFGTISAVQAGYPDFRLRVVCVKPKYRRSYIGYGYLAQLPNDVLAQHDGEVRRSIALWRHSYPVSEVGIDESNQTSSWPTLSPLPRTPRPRFEGVPSFYDFRFYDIGSHGSVAERGASSNSDAGALSLAAVAVGEDTQLASSLDGGQPKPQTLGPHLPLQAEKPELTHASGSSSTTIALDASKSSHDHSTERLPPLTINPDKRATQVNMSSPSQSQPTTDTIDQPTRDAAKHTTPPTMQERITVSPSQAANQSDNPASIRPPSSNSETKKAATPTPSAPPAPAGQVCHQRLDFDRTQPPPSKDLNHQQTPSENNSAPISTCTDNSIKQPGFEVRGVEAQDTDATHMKTETQEKVVETETVAEHQGEQTIQTDGSTQGATLKAQDMETVKDNTYAVRGDIATDDVIEDVDMDPPEAMPESFLATEGSEDKLVSKVVTTENDDVDDDAANPTEQATKDCAIHTAQTTDPHPSLPAPSDVPVKRSQRSATPTALTASPTPDDLVPSTSENLTTSPPEPELPQSQPSPRPEPLQSPTNPTPASYSEALAEARDTQREHSDDSNTTVAQRPKPRLTILDDEVTDVESPPCSTSRSDRTAIAPKNLSKQNKVSLINDFDDAAPGLDAQLQVLNLLRDRGVLAYPWVLRKPSPSMPSSIFIVEVCCPEDDSLEAFKNFRLSFLPSSEQSQLRLVLDCRPKCPLDMAKARLHAAGLVSVTAGTRLEPPADEQYSNRYQFRVADSNANVIAGMQAVMMHREQRRVVYIWKTE